MERFRTAQHSERDIIIPKKSRHDVCGDFLDFEGNILAIWVCPLKAFTKEPVRPPGVSGAPGPHLLIDPVTLSVCGQQQCYQWADHRAEHQSSGQSHALLCM